MENDDTVVEETPIFNVHDSSTESEPDVAVKKTSKAKTSKRKRNDKEEEEYEIYEKTIKERAPIWEHYDPKQKQQQTHLEFKKNASGECTSTLQTWKHDKGRIKKALIELFVVGELPFKFVEHEAFINYTHACNGRVVLPSRHKLSRDVSKYYLDERSKLIAYLAKPTTTIHLTTDTWTSTCQRTNYMVVMANFIDDDWNMHKRIINFRPIKSHRADDISGDLLKCIVGWGIKNVMAMTVDNSPSNDKAIGYLIKKLPNARLYDDGKHFHVRCMAHVLNLIVQEGLKVKNYHVECLSNAVRYIRQSTQRIKKFKACMKESGLESNRFLCGECPTRWNSKHDMLKIAIELRDAFFKYEVEDDCYYRDLDRVPEHSDFGACKDIVEFLEKFKAKTELISSTSKPLAHLFFGEILDVDKHLRHWETKPDFCMMVHDMVDDVLNDMVSEMVKKVVQRMEVLFKTYKIRFDTVGFNGSSRQTRNQESSTQGSSDQESSKAYGRDNDFVYDFLNLEESGLIESESELTRYLNEPRIRYTRDFDILEWWKLNAPRFPIVSRMAKDWVRKSRKAIIDDIDDILNDGDVARDVEEPLDLIDKSEELLYESLIKDMPTCSLNYDFRIRKGDPRNLKIPCMIGHKFMANAYIDVDLPMNIMYLAYNYIQKDGYEYRGRNFVGLGRDMHVFVGNMSYVMDFTILENIETNINPSLSHVVFGRPFVEIACLAINRKHGLMTFMDGIREVTFKTPYKDPKKSELTSEGHDLLSSRVILSGDDYDRGC
ncbi:zinc finger BED domain-containing protein RICESLEEPER 2 [Tanacetum coccineum]